jgi:PKD repeat protein/uncharacterized membrane protein
VTLTVTDDDSAIGKDSCIVNVDNVKPVAGFIVNPIEGTVATVFQFESTSYDTDGFVTKFYWDFGDGNTASEPNPTHQYSTRGTYKVSLLVQDDDGLNSDEFEIEIILSNQIPIAIAESSTNIAEVGENIEFDATRSYDPDGNIISYMWQLGDGTYANGQIIQHSFDKKGTYTITLTVTDDVNIPASTSFEVDIIEMFSDFDNDNLPDDIDLDDDNDGLPDIWEKKYGLTITDPSDANIDTDDDDLNNLEEYLHQTDPTNPDTDGEGLLDGEEIKIYHTNASNPDTDGDSYNDKIDAYPNNPNKHKLVEAYHEDEYKYNLQFIISIIIIILVAIIIIITIVIRKKRRALIGEPYIKNEILHDLSNNVLNDSDGQNLSLSRDNMLRTLETRYANGEVSEETYKYIRNEILYREYDLDTQADLIEK